MNNFLLFTWTSNHSSFPLVVAYCRIEYHDIFFSKVHNYCHQTLSWRSFQRLLFQQNTFHVIVRWLAPVLPPRNYLPLCSLQNETTLREIFCSLCRCGWIVFQICWIGYSLFWFVMQRALVVVYRRFGQPFGNLNSLSTSLHAFNSSALFTVVSERWK